MSDVFQELSQFGRATLIVAGLAGILAGLLAWRCHARGESIHRRPGTWFASWSPQEVIGIILLYLIVPSLMAGVLRAVGFAESSPDSDIGSSIRLLWASVLAFPLFLLCCFLLLRDASGTTPGDFGLRTGRLDADFVAGYRGWLIAIPMVFPIFAGVSILWQSLTGQEPDSHPLIRLWAEADRWDQTALWLRVVVIAPFQEEFLCRGLLLALVSQSLTGSRFVAGVSVLLGFLFAEGDWITVLVATLFPLVIFVGHLLRFRDEASPWHGIIATASFFAAAHSSVWPSPVPLFVLGCVLGWVAIRTRSIVPAVVLHGLFNAVTAVQLTLGEVSG